MSEHDPFDIIDCPCCDAEQFEAEARIGTLGTRAHYRCNYCHGGWSISTEPELTT